MKGRKQVFEEAFEAYADELFRHAYFRLSDREKAVDLVQETYLRAFAYSGNDTIADVRAFLYRTLRHLIIDEYRKKKSYSLDAMMEEERDTEALIPIDESNTIEAAMDRLDGKDALSKLPLLPEHYAEALILRFVDGLSPKEIAKRLKITENLASVRIHRALKELKHVLERKRKK